MNTLFALIGIVLLALVYSFIEMLRCRRRTRELIEKLGRKR